MRHKALIGDTDDAGGGQHRHLAHQRNGDLFEQEREAAALAGPRHIDPQHPMLGTVATRQLGDDGAVMLEEVEVAPGELGKVMGFARSAAHRAGK
jgi:hypothetical protein